MYSPSAYVREGKVRSFEVAGDVWGVHYGCTSRSHAEVVEGDREVEVRKGEVFRFCEVGLLDTQDVDVFYYVFDEGAY